MFSDDLPPALTKLSRRARAAGAAAGRGSTGAAAAPVSFEEGTAGAAVQCQHPAGFPLSYPLNINSTPTCPVCSTTEAEAAGQCQRDGVCGLVPGCQYHDRCQAAWAMVTEAGK